MNRSGAEYLMEELLEKFYLITSIAGPFISKQEHRGIYDALLSVYCIPESESTEEYYIASCSKFFRDIDDLASYQRLSRSIEFAQISGQNVELSGVERTVLAHKREALIAKQEIFKQSRNMTVEVVYDTLLREAMNGSIQAMSLLAFMEYHGICICKDERRAINRIRLCGVWNDLFGNLMGIAYDRENRERYFNRLNSILRTAGQRQMFCRICAVCKKEGVCGGDAVARIIEKAFGLGIVSRERYDRAFAKVAFSRLLSVEDKEKLLLDKQKDAIACLTGIPFDASGKDTLDFDRTCLDGLPLKREKEARRILQNLALSARISAGVLSPLLVAGEDQYVVEMYKNALKKGFFSSRVIEIDASTLSIQDFVPSKENIFLRGISETKEYRTVFFITDCESLEGQELEELCRMLDKDYRNKLRLAHPPVSLDLSGVIIVLFAKARSAACRVLSDRCDTLWVERVTQQEKEGVVKAIFEDGRRAYGNAELTLDADCSLFLAAYETSDAARILDYAIQSALYDGLTLITREMLMGVCRDREINITRKGFGFVGGNENA